MKKLFCVLALLVFCGITNAELIPNPESFEYTEIIYLWQPLGQWQSWGSGSGSGGWTGGNDWPVIIVGDGTDGTRCLETAVPGSLYSGYVLAFNNGNPIVPGEIYEYFFDYKPVGAATDAIVKLELYDSDNYPLNVIAWDPMPTTTPDVWQHFSYTFRAPKEAVSATVVVGATGPGSTLRYDMVGLLPADCPYELEGDEDGDCRVTLADFALLAANWLVDCIDDPADPACVTP
ncbi:MAG: hypothetical protein H8E62_10135 [Planctomycetes bacterium]|nr:hypothetical protein [Planctomycetota bacterium]